MDILKGWLPHLEALRGHIIRTLLVWLAVAVAVFAAREPVLALLKLPLQQAAPGVPLLTTGVTEMFAAYLKIAVWGGFLLSLPYLLFEVWRFLKPALYQHERHLLLAALCLVPLFAFTGAAFAWQFLLPPILSFFLGFSAEGVAAMPRVADYIGLLMLTMVLMALAFNLPLLMLVLVKLGWVNIQTLRKQRRLAVLVIFVVAALATPPDPASQLLVAIPLWALFEVALLVAARLR